MDLTRLNSSLSAFSAVLQSKFTKYPKVKIGRFVTSADELTYLMNSIPDQSAVFNDWYRFSHNSTGVFPGLPDELDTWSYDEATGLIHNNTNSTSFIGVVSSKTYSDYTLDVALSSNANDDDLIGLVLAFDRDATTGKEYTLTAVRSPGGNQPLWGLCYNYNQASAGGSKDLVNGSATVKYGNGADGALSVTDAGYLTNTPEVAWSAFAGTRIYAQRVGDVITAKTSLLTDANTLLDSTLLTLDLSSDPVLARFMGASAYGFCASSQANSTWSVNRFTASADVIFNIITGQVYEKVGDAWEVSSAYTLADLGTNTVLVCMETGRSFFIQDANNIVDLGSTLLK